MQRGLTNAVMSPRRVSLEQVLSSLLPLCALLAAPAGTAQGRCNRLAAYRGARLQAAQHEGPLEQQSAAAAHTSGRYSPLGPGRGGGCELLRGCMDRQQQQQQQQEAIGHSAGPNRCGTEGFREACDWREVVWAVGVGK